MKNHNPLEPISGFLYSAHSYLEYIILAVQPSRQH